MDPYDLPSTQIQRPLAGVIALIDVRSGGGGTENRSAVFSSKLHNLGATISKKLNKDVTHLVFKDGHVGILKKAKERHLSIVSPLWVEACCTENDRAAETKYPVIGLGTETVLGSKLKRIKSMQPKPFTEIDIQKCVGHRKKRSANLGSHVEMASVSGNPPMDRPDSPVDMFEDAISLSEGLKDFEIALTSVERPDHLSDLWKDTEQNNLGTDTATGKGRASPCAAGKKRSPGVSKQTKKKSKNCVSKKCKAETTHAISKDPKSKTPSNNGGKCQSPLAVPVKVSNSSVERQAFREVNRSKAKARVKQGNAFSQKPTIVLTSCSKSDQEVFCSIIKKLGRFELSPNVTSQTTHVVSGASRRTMNILMATALGCWILSTEWIWKSLEAERWIEENPFEMKEEFPTAHETHIVRERVKGVYRPLLFKDVGSIFVSPGATVPNQEKMQELIKVAGGKICGSKRKASIIIGASHGAVLSVTEQWIFDSVMVNKTLSTSLYPVFCTALTQHESPSMQH